MVAKVNKAEMTAIGAFFLMFPMFYIYHFCVAKGLNPFLYGYTVRIGIACILPLLAFYVFQLRLSGHSFFIDLVFFGFLVYQILWISVANRNIPATIINDSYFGAILIWISFFLTAKLLPLNSKKLSKIVLFTQIIMLVIIYSQSRNGVFVLGSGVSSATYQSFAVLYFITAALTLVIIKKSIHFRTQVLIAVLTLMLIGARAELVGFLILTFVLLLLKPQKFSNIVFFAFLAICIAVNLDIIELFSDSRVYDLIVNKAEGTRFHRAWANDLATATLWRYPVTGNYASYPPGYYAHNFLSVWVDFGLLGFCWFLLLLGLPTLLLLRKLLDSKDNQIFICLALLVVTIILVLLVKSFVYFLVPFSVGLASSRLSDVSFKAQQ